MAFIPSRLLFFIRIASIILIFTVSANGQPDIPQNPPTPDSPPVPITGLEYLLLAGGALGGYKMFRKSNKENDKKHLT